MLQDKVTDSALAHPLSNSSLRVLQLAAYDSRGDRQQSEGDDG